MGGYTKEVNKKLEERENIKIIECDSFIDKELHFLGLSPDGIAKDDNFIIEMKCPSSSYLNLFPNKAILQKMFNFWKIDKSNSVITEIKTKLYFQVQGQLHITHTKKEWCFFVLWTPKGINVEKIYRGDTFWKEKGKRSSDFYFDCLLPEIIDTRPYKINAH